ncbi:MAG: hypothetical protein K0B09_00830 [Bacteroidales bacterium]|nr:hypothetical protein [Bacteroidales bacterium]
MKKFEFAGWAILVSVILIILSLWALLNHFQRRSQAVNLDPYTLVPSDAWLVADIKKSEDLSNLLVADTLLWKELQSLDEISWLRQRLQAVDSLLEGADDIKAIYRQSRLLVSLHTAIRGQSPVLLQLRPEPASRPAQFQRFVQKQWEQHQNGNSYSFLGIKIFQFDAAQSSFFFALYKGSLLLAPGKRLIEHAITQDISGSSLAVSESLSELRSVAGRRTNNVFLDGSRLCELFEKIIHVEPPSLFPCKAFSGWMGWDFALLGEEVRLTGFARGRPEQTDFLGLFSGQQPTDPFLMKYIPSATAAFALANFEMSDDLSKSLEGFRKQVNEREPPDSALLAALAPHLGSSAATALLYAPGISRNQGSIAIINIQDRDGLWEKLQDQQLWETSQPTLLPADTVFGQLIWHFVPAGLVPALSHGLITDELPFVALLDSVLIAGAEVMAVNRTLMQIHYGQIIGKEPRLAEDFIFQQPASGLLYMVNIPYLSGMMQGSWSPAVNRLLAQIGQGAFPLDRFTAQFAAHRNGLFFSNVSIHRHGARITRLHQSLWEVQLDTLALTEPFGVFNHNDGSREIVLQDQKNIFYLIDRFGNILWKKEISGPINSAVYQVDRYKNGRYQYLFSTRNFLHLIDRNGNYVTGYPQRLPSAADHGITVVDYDADKNYRILFSGEDRRIHNLGIDGRRVGGWLLPRLEKAAGTPIQYLRIDQRDYLIVVDEDGRPHFFDRRGQVRFEIPEGFKLSLENSLFGLESGPESRLVALGQEGYVLEISSSGEVTSFKLDSLESGTGFLFLPSGLEPLYVFAGQQSLRVLDRLGTEVFVHHLAGSLALPIKKISAAGKSFISVRTQNPDQLYLFDLNGNLISPFPIEGQQYFALESLMQDQAWNVVSVQNQKVVAYLIGGL